MNASYSLICLLSKKLRSNACRILNLRNKIKVLHKRNADLELRVRSLEQVRLIYGDNNRWLAGEKLKHSPDAREAILHFIEKGGAKHFAEVDWLKCAQCDRLSRPGSKAA